MADTTSEVADQTAISVPSIVKQMQLLRDNKVAPADDSSRLQQAIQILATSLLRQARRELERSLEESGESSGGNNSGIPQSHTESTVLPHPNPHRTKSRKT